MRIITLRKLILLGVTLIVNAGALASKPLTVEHIQDIVDNNHSYSHYVVKCSNGNTADISAWDNRNKWCIGKGRKDDCSKQQIKAARKVCR